MRSRAKWGRLALVGTMAALLAGCGTPGAPLPPSLNLPDRVADLSASRAGNRVSLSWTMPRRTTDKLILKNEVGVRVCRAEGAGVCTDAGTLTVAPGTGGTWAETLPTALAEGSPRVLRYFVELKNKRGRSAGLSNVAIVLAGVAPQPVAGLTVEMRKAGAVLRWNVEDPRAAVRLQRTLLTPPATKKNEGLLAPEAEPVEQRLLIEDAAQGRAIDKSVRFGETYAYRAQRVRSMTVDGQVLELDGELSAAVRVEAKDVFPPAVPIGLVAVATRGGDGRAASVDLSWEPDAEEDITGYVVYRREADGPWERISPAQPMVGPAFHDAQVEPGHAYRYAVSAVDAGGHESARSAEIEQSLPHP
jgi:hypothetical protein